jgi:hypothetical protein
LDHLKPHKSVEQIAKKHRLDVSFIQKQLDMGAPIEHEHTKDKVLATDIALQHLDEIPDYYTRLKKMEASAKKEHKKFKDVKEQKSEMRYCGLCRKEESQEDCKYGPDMWSKYTRPQEMITQNQMKYDPNRPHPANEEKDYEYSMARSELSTIMNAAKRLKKKMKGEGNIEAWVQSKITKAADYIDTAADYIDGGESKVNEDVTLEDANGNTFVQIIDIIKADRLVKEGKKMKGEDPCWKGYEMIGKKKKGGKEVPNCVPEQLSFEIGGGHKAAQKQAKIRNLATGTSNPNEKKVALGKLSGPSLPLANSYTPKTFAKFMIEAKKSEMKCNFPKSEPVGDSLTGKSHVVKACENGKEKLIRFGQRGVKGSPKKEGESKEYASRRNRFQTRHAKNIAKGKMSAAYWANKVKW